MRVIHLPASVLTGIGIAGATGASLLIAQPVLQAADLGVIESVREVQAAAAGPSDFSAALELAHGNGNEVVVRLNDGRPAVIVQNEAISPQLGERVRVSTVKRSVRLESVP